MNHSRVTPTRITPLSEEEVEKIVASYRPGEVGYMALAKKFGTSTGTIRSIIKQASDKGEAFAPPKMADTCKSGKRSYVAYETASKAASYINQRHPSKVGGSVWAYRCPKCQEWHVGRLKP